MTGQVNVQKLKEREMAKTLKPSDRPLIGLIELARLKLDELTSPQNTQELKNKLQGASNHLSRQILKYWSQNKHLHVQFDLRPALPKDPEEMNQVGTMNLWGEVYDSAHGATLRLGTRSKGFIWFFSFLAWFSQQRRLGVPLILLLDEPGLVLHASAQNDLLRYIEVELKPHHQVIYTTHSPFMIDSRNFDRVRIVRDRSMEEDEPLPDDERGTKVFTDILEADPDSLFPLQGALGYDIAQTLFIGPNSLIVEGVSDLLFLTTISGLLAAQQRDGLSDSWTITPVGGSDKVPTFVALMGSQKKLNVATLIDFQKKDQQSIENLYKKKLLDKKNVLTFVDFTGTSEADIEDMFDRQFYLDLVNAEYAAVLSKPIKLADLGKHPRIITNIEEHLKANPLKSGGFNHYRPARYFAENIHALGPKLDAATLDRFHSAFVALNGLL
jgi:predicted ATP-dependent endonuclease of OLD family